MHRPPAFAALFVTAAVCAAGPASATQDRYGPPHVEPDSGTSTDAANPAGPASVAAPTVFLSWPGKTASAPIPRRPEPVAQPTPTAAASITSIYAPPAPRRDAHTPAAHTPAAQAPATQAPRLRAEATLIQPPPKPTPALVRLAPPAHPQIPAPTAPVKVAKVEPARTASLRPASPAITSIYTPPQGAPQPISKPIVQVVRVAATPAPVSAPAPSAVPVKLASVKATKASHAAPTPAPASKASPVVASIPVPATAVVSQTALSQAQPQQTGEPPRFYSVHRQYGVTPDPIPLPAQFFADAGNADLAEPPPPVTPRILSNGQAASSATTTAAARQAATAARNSADSTTSD
ncbi:MAG: hypothetical protein P4L64_10470 [Caulobacteraceae bacterium]|nr:hypothetical protein [Caulobacteraceae bacterium]